MSSTERVVIGAAAGGAEDISAAAGVAIVVGAWEFVIGRFVSATNRRITRVEAAGGVTHASDATSIAPTGMDAIAIGALYTSGGASLPWNGLIAEYWLTNTDIQEDGGQLDANLARQLAYGGPFSVPHIAKDIIEYRSLRKSIESDQDEVGENYWGGAGRQVWTNTNGVTRGPHPPLPGWYRSPNDARLMVPF